MFEIKLIFYGLSRMLQFSQFVWALSYSAWDVLNNFLLIDATDRSKISSDQKRFLSHQTYTLFHFSRTLLLNCFLFADFKRKWQLGSCLQEAMEKLSEFYTFWVRKTRFLDIKVSTFVGTVETRTLLSFHGGSLRT